MMNTHEDIQDVTAQVLHDLLTENTGTHFLDSGMSCGRHWQRNQGRSFENEKPATLDASWGYLDITVNLYHWLKARLEYNEKLDQRFRKFATTGEMEGEHWLACVEAFMKVLADEAEENGTAFGGIYGDGEPVGVNTYNHEALLSQVIQYTYWEDEDGEHVLLQVHGGADVRGGYTRPVAFDLNGHSECAIFEDCRATVRCSDKHAAPDQMLIPGTKGDAVADKGSCGAYWDFDAGYWSDYDKDGYTLGLEMQNCEIVKYDAEMEDGSEPKAGDGYIFVDEEGVPHCPLCGSPLVVDVY